MFEAPSSEGKRGDWVFTYSAKTLFSAATAKRDHHLSRREWWSKKKEEVLAEIKQDGLSVNESIVDELMKVGYSNNTRVVNQGSVYIKPELLEQMRECQTKISAHADSATVYDGWIQAMQAAGDKSFELNINDWLFFFSK